MINTICSEWLIAWSRNTGDTWSLHIFDTIKHESHDISTPLNSDTALLYKYEVMEQKWDKILELSASHVWMIGRIPFQNSGIK
jgi:hypothetical protein